MSYDKTNVWCFTCLSHKICFFFDYSGVWWHAMFNIHLSVPANFLLFIYLDVFLWLSFVWMNICHFFYLLGHSIVIVYATHLKGQLEILTLTSWYQHWHCKILFLPYKIFLENKTWPIQLLCSLIWQQYHFATINHLSMILFSPIQEQPLVLKKCFLNFWSTYPFAFLKKIVATKILWNFPKKHPAWSS